MGYQEIYPKNGSLPGNNVRVRMYECIEYSFQLSNLKIFQKSILKFFSVFVKPTCFVPRIRCLSATNELKTHFQTISFVQIKLQIVYTLCKNDIKKVFLNFYSRPATVMGYCSLKLLIITLIHLCFTLELSEIVVEIF